MTEFYPEITPYNEFLLKADHQHELYVEECGNPKGEPVVFLHGGPGGGCSTNDRRFFDPSKYRVILFDQRGCGRSTPHGCLDNNDTKSIVGDIEKIREKLNIQTWHVFGGSWGSTLSLVYAQTHPHKVKSLVLRGIFLARQKDTDWTFNGGGATRIYPDHWDEYLTALPSGITESSVKIAYDILTGEDKEAAMKLAKAWSTWEIKCATVLPNKEFVDAASQDNAAWTLARHESHFMINDLFLSENQIINNCDKIKDIPTIIVHGRYDIVCAFDNAWLLHQHLPKSQLVISETAGHASIEPETINHLVNATNKMLG